MSTRVGLMIVCAWLVLAANADGQIGRYAPSDQTGRPAVLGAETETWLAQAATGEQVSNAPRAVSYAKEIQPVPSQATSSRHVSRSASDSRRAGDEADQLAPMPLPPRSKRQSRQSTSRAGSSSGHALVTVLSSLAVVLAVFFAFVWLTRSAAPKGMATLSKDVVESLGRAPLLGRQQMQLIRIGNKLILLSVTATGADTLTEITDPVEVDRLAGLCRQAQSGSISDTFRQVLAAGFGGTRDLAKK